MQPTLAYTAYTFQNRMVLVMRWVTIFTARKAARKTLDHFSARGLPCKVWKHFVDEQSGEYEVWFLFGKESDPGAIAREL